MSRELTYRGFVCRNGDEFRLVVKDQDNKNLFRTIPFNGFTNESFEELNSYTAKIIAVKFFDGTEQLSLNNVLENDFEDTVLSIRTNASIQVESDNTVFDLISESYEDMVRMWELVETYYDSEDGIEKFESYVNKDIWEK